VTLEEQDDRVREVMEEKSESRNLQVHPVPPDFEAFVKAAVEVKMQELKTDFMCELPLALGSAIQTSGILRREDLTAVTYGLGVTSCLS